MTIRYGSVCSGIDAPTVAWKPLGWEAAWFAEIERFPCAVLHHHYGCGNPINRPSPTKRYDPQAKQTGPAPNLGDITKITEEQLNEHGPIDILVGGTPCQSFSVAGLRGGLADPRGNLTLTFLDLVRRTKPRHVVWENVPGVLSDSTMALHSFLDGLEEIGYAITGFDILDAQYFGLAQRRRRVFVCAQSIDDLLTRKTSFSGLIAAQCLAEIWQHTLAVLCERLNHGVENSDSANSKSMLSLQKRIGLFGLQKAEQVSRLLDCLGVLRQLSECEPSGLGSESGKVSSLMPESTVGTKFGGLDGQKESISESKNTEPSWRTTLVDGLRIANECITSTSTNETTESEIYTCATAMLSTAGFMRGSLASAPGFSTAAGSCLTGLWEHITYARQTSYSLFTAVEWVRRWRDFLRQAESASLALGNLGIRNFGQIQPLSENLCGYSPPGRERGTKSAALTANGVGICGADDNQAQAGHLIATGLTARYGKGADSDYTDTLLIIPILEANARQGLRDSPRDGIGIGKNGDPMFTLQSSAQHAIAYRTSGNSGVMEQGDKTAALNCGTDPNQQIVAYQCQGTHVGEMGLLRAGNGNETGGVPFVVEHMVVRRLTPLECERLQGFPDGFTNIPYGHPKYPDQICPDGPRYKALGNSMAIPPMRWIGKRIMEATEL